MVRVIKGRSGVAPKPREPRVEVSRIVRADQLGNREVSRITTIGKLMEDGIEVTPDPTTALSAAEMQPERTMPRVIEAVFIDSSTGSGENDSKVLKPGDLEGKKIREVSVVGRAPGAELTKDSSRIIRPEQLDGREVTAIITMPRRPMEDENEPVTNPRIDTKGIVPTAVEARILTPVEPGSLEDAHLRLDEMGTNLRALTRLVDGLKEGDPATQHLLQRLLERMDTLEIRLAQMQERKTNEVLEAYPPFYLRVLNGQTDAEFIPIPVMGDIVIGSSGFWNRLTDTRLEHLRIEKDALQTAVEILRRRSHRYMELLATQELVSRILNCKQAIPIDGGRVSALQALVELLGGIRPKLFLHALGTNPLVVNGREIGMVKDPLSRGIELADGDQIEVVSGSERIVKIYQPASHIRTLIVACDYTGKHQEGYEEGVAKIEYAIGSSSRHASTTKIIGKEATPKRMLQELEALQNEDPKALVVIVIYAHGSTDSLHLYRDAGEPHAQPTALSRLLGLGPQIDTTDSDQAISKQTIAELLEKIPCKKIVMVNACHAAGFWEGMNVPNTQFVLSSRADQFTWGSRFLDDVAAVIRRNIKNGMVDLRSLNLDYGNQSPGIRGELHTSPIPR